MKRLGIIGAGGHARRHAIALRALLEHDPSHAELTSVCDLNQNRAEAYRREFGFLRAYTDINTMLDNEQLDALLVITPVSATEPIVTSLFSRNIPLLIEKPPGPTSDHARRLLALAQKHNTPHMLSFNRRYSPALVAATRWLAQNPETRKPRYILARIIRHRRHEPEFATSTGIHLLDAVLSILGAPSHVATVKMPSGTSGCFHYAAHIEFTNGTHANLLMAPDSGTLEETYEIHGQQYCIHADAWNGPIRIYDNDQLVLEEDIKEHASAEIVREERYGTLGEMEHFITWLENPATPVPTLRDGLLALLTAEAVSKGGYIEIPPLDP